MKVPAFLSIAVAISSAAHAQVEFGGSYAQTFDGLGTSGTAILAGRGPHAITGVLGSTGVLGWSGANFAGSSTSTEFKAHDGSLASSAGRGVVFFGSTGSSERALGALPTSNQISSFGVVLQNGTSRPFAEVRISYVGEQWRAGSPGILNVLEFSLGIGTTLESATTAVNALDFPAPFLGGGEVPLNGNDPTNQRALAASIRDLAWRPGESLVLRWDMTEFSGQDNALAIDDLEVIGVPGIASLDLADYELSATHLLPPVAASEASAVTYNWDTGTLFVLGDEGDALVEVTTTGAEVSQMTLLGFDDTEGVTYVGDGRFVIGEERIQDVYLLTYAAGGSVARSSLPFVSLGGTVGNQGLEGLSYDPVADNYVTVKEKLPQEVNLAVIDWSVPSGSSAPLFAPNLGVLDLSDVQVLATVPTLRGTPDEGNLLIYSQESAVLLEVTRKGAVLSSFSFAGIAGDAEGVTIGIDGTIYVVGETPALYVLTPKEPATCPADLNDDGVVNGADLSILLADWGGAGAGDLNGDGVVNGADLSILLAAWGDC